jgi:hypothetical protein
MNNDDLDFGATLRGFRPGQRYLTAIRSPASLGKAAWASSGLRMTKSWSWKVRKFRFVIACQQLTTA